MRVLCCGWEIIARRPVGRPIKAFIYEVGHRAGPTLSPLDYAVSGRKQCKYRVWHGQHYQSAGCCAAANPPGEVARALRRNSFIIVYVYTGRRIKPRPFVFMFSGLVLRPRSNVFNVKTSMTKCVKIKLNSCTIIHRFTEAACIVCGAWST